MEQLVFSGSAKLETADFIEGEQLVVKKSLFGVMHLIFRVIGVLSIGLGMLYLVLMPFMENTDNIGDAIKMLILGMILLLCSENLFKGTGKKRAKSPINQNRTASIELYEDRLIYSDEYFRVKALYSDVAYMIKGKGVIVIAFKGTNHIILPIRCFGWNNSGAAVGFLQQKLKGLVK